MMVREWIDKNKQLAAVATVILLAFSIGMVVYQLLPEGPITKAWYTSDDGRTWFKASNRRVAPFAHEGKEAVEAFVFECEGKEFVGYMRRYKPSGKKRLEEYYAAEDAGKEPDVGKLAGLDFLLEYKRPGEKEWTSELHKGTEMMYVNCKDGSPALIVRP